MALLSLIWIISLFRFLQLDMKYLSPLLLAYEDRMNEKDALLQTTEVMCVSELIIHSVSVMSSFSGMLHGLFVFLP